MVAASEDESLLAVMVIGYVPGGVTEEYDAQNGVIIVDVASSNWPKHRSAGRYRKLHMISKSW